MEEKKPLAQRPVFRVGLLLAVVLIMFLGVRQLALPKSFGEFGYYRGDNVNEQTELKTVYSQGSSNCQTCHNPRYTEWSQASHATVSCETCHGPRAEHIATGGTIKAPINPTREFCASCHNILEARPQTSVKQIDVEKHNAGMACVQCHQPHKPSLNFGKGVS